MIISPFNVKKAVEFLNREKSGCYFKRILTDDEGKTWGVVIGWSDGYDSGKEGFWRICSKIAYQDKHTGMSCDYDMDFTMPYNVDTGDVYDTSVELGVDYELEAERLCLEFKEVVEGFAVFYDKIVEVA